MPGLVRRREARTFDARWDYDREKRNRLRRCVCDLARKNATELHRRATKLVRRYRRLHDTNDRHAVAGLWLAAAGKFFEGLVVFMTGVSLPLIAQEFHLSKIEHGMVSAASLAGILAGAVGLGGLSDRFGRRSMFILESFVFLTFLALLVVSPNFVWLVTCLFGLGLAWGAITRPRT